ncbi:MAG: FAD-binding oxidoreductase [Gammaproteobacteria bacterium]|nr:FAD-binding oxidoreductase [Gammaproteobacteria bacterium]
MNSSIFSDDFRPEPYWWDETPRTDCDEKVLPEEVDVLIIGSGYTGLNCAIETARAGRDTLVIDSQSIGWGCSSRNGGQISGEIKPGFEELQHRYGESKAFALTKEARNALEWIQSFIDSENIDCDLRRCGRYLAAHNPRQFQQLCDLAENQPRGLEQPLTVVESRQQATEIDSDYYHGGLVIERHCSLDPAKYHQGLVERVLSAGARLVGYCEARSIQRERSGFSVLTGKGSIRAAKIVVATSGYTGSVSAWQRRRLIPIGSYMLATEELDIDRVQRLLPRDRVFSDTRKLVVYFRQSPDARRILFGGRVSVFESDPVKSTPALRQEMLRIFPQLADAKISHSWMGFVGFSFDYLPHLGEHDGLYYAMGYCGSGICLASYFGHKLGRQLQGDTGARIAFNDIPFQTRPLYSGKPWFLAGAVQYYQLRDRFI